MSTHQQIINIPKQIELLVTLKIPLLYHGLYCRDSVCFNVRSVVFIDVSEIIHVPNDKIQSCSLNDWIQSM